MPKVLRLEASKHVKGRVLVFFQDAELIKLTEDAVLLHQLYAGKELSDAVYQDLTELSKLSSAKTTAARICSGRMLSRGELLQKLREKGEDEACGELAADWLEELGVLNDARYAASLVRHYAGRGYGRKKIESELFRRLVPREFWAEALRELGDPEETIDRLIQKKLRSPEPDEKELIRVQNFLLRRGFSWEQVKEGLRRYADSSEWEDC